MGSEWTTTSIGEVCDKVLTGGTPLKSRDDYFNNPTVPWLKTKEVNFCRIYETENHISEIGLNESAAKLVPKNSVIVAMYGQGDTAGRVAINKIPLCTNQACCNLVVDNNKADYQFIYYKLKDSYAELVRRKTGSAQPNLNTKIVKDFELQLPPLPEQKAIAHILGSLDDKVELNRRMNATLEGMAQALFKSWFVDFDPVIDNALAAGNPIPDELAPRAEVRRQALANREAAQAFPASFYEIEAMGWIPEGWEVSAIGEESDTVGGGTPSTKNPDFWEDGEYPWVTPKDFSSLQDKVLLSSSRYLTEAGLAKVSSGLLPEGTVLMSSRAPVGYLAITQIETAINQGFIGMICNKRLPSEYVLQWANSRMVDIKQASSGSTFAEISKRTFRPFKVVVPHAKALEAYQKIASASYSRIADNVAASETLSKLRDTLLLKLISGELRIPEAEQLTEEALG